MPPPALMAGRKRTRLVPSDHVEVFEARVVWMIGPDGEMAWNWDVDTPDHEGGDGVNVVEAAGLLMCAAVDMVLSRMIENGELGGLGGGRS